MTEKEQVIQALRATLISVKGALTLRQCNRDYRELQGEWIPFKKLGYSSLEKLFQNVPGFKVEQINGEWYVDAIASQETQHIASMVARQKSSKRTGPKLHFVNRFPKKQESWRKPVSSNAYTSNYHEQYSKQLYRPKQTNYGYNNNNQSYKGDTKSTRPNDYKQAPKIVRDPENAPKKMVNNVVNEQPSKIEQIKEKNQTKTEQDNYTIKQKKITASQRLSNLRDRLNTVPLQFPVSKSETCESSGPVTHVAAAHYLEPPPDSTSPIVKLEWTCKKLGLPQPVFRVYEMDQKRGRTEIYCAVKVDPKYNVTSYPEASSTEDLARNLVAVKLLTLIESSELEGLPSSPSSKAVENLIDLISAHEAGLWASTVPLLYREKFGENIPSNWQELVEHCPLIIKDKLVDGTILLVDDQTDVCLKPEDTTFVSDETVESDLPPLQFPDHYLWNVFVTVANSTLEIWLRIIGTEYSDALEELLLSMNKYYSKHGSRVDKFMLIKNAWYVVNLEDGGWQRAKILDIEENTVNVFLGDHGDDDVVSIDDIRILEPQFRKLPAQAILCRLEGAEELAPSAAAGELVRARLVGRVLVAAPGPRDDPADPAVAVVLYDTSTAKDLNLNTEIVHDFCISSAFTVISQKPCEVEVGSVTDEGRVWLQRAGGSALVRAALALVTDGPYRRPLPAAPPAPPPAAHPQLYIVRTRDGDWVRCNIISGLDGEGTVRTLLVDSGLILRAPLSSLVPLQTFSPVLNEFPHQALQVRLGAADRAAKDMVPRLREMLLGRSVLCRALPTSGPMAAPHVELFVRTGPQAILASVNNAILMEFECLQMGKQINTTDDTTDHVEVLNRKKERIFRSGSSGGGGGAAGGLPPPTLPAPGACLDVFVAMAANPWNFVIQPNATRHTLKSMMTSLQEECPKLPESEAPQCPANGELYTAFYEKDSSWYRVTIAGTVSSEMVSVYFCDYGDLALLPARALRPVPAAAPLARALPPQAIKARLHDVRPLHQDWTVEDCIRFQELCVEQQFVGVCKSVGKDPLNPLEPLLTLELIDTSTEEDRYLGRQLVAESRAQHAAEDKP